MKTLVLTLAALFSISAFAIEGSSLEARHQQAIKSAVKNQCSVRMASYKEVNTTVRTVRVDQGVIDQYFVTTLEVVDRIDQGVADVYVATIESAIHDAYDHSSAEWGIISVDSVKCEFSRSL